MDFPLVRWSLRGCVLIVIFPGKSCSLYEANCMAGRGLLAFEAAFLHRLGGSVHYRMLAPLASLPVLWSLLVVATTDKISKVLIHSRCP